MSKMLNKRYTRCILCAPSLGFESKHIFLCQSKLYKRSENHILSSSQSQTITTLASYFTIVKQLFSIPCKLTSNIYDVGFFVA
jgi:hypothetical protein